MKIIRIPKESNLNYMPLMYFLPEDLIVKCPTLYSLPRCLGVISRSRKLIEIIGSDTYLREIMDAVAALVFPHFGFGGWKEHYTGYCPIWQLTYALPIWANLLEEETDWGLQAMLRVPSSRSIPFLAPDYIKEVMSRIVKRAIVEEGWQPILDVIREMPCDEDFEKRDTNVRKDFLRKWYHTRSKNVQMISLESCIEDDTNHIHEIADSSSGFEDKVIAEDYCERFKERLSAKDMEILGLRVQGFTYEAIAERMGYKTHSAVIKRMNAITKEFITYEEEQ